MSSVYWGIRKLIEYKDYITTAAYYYHLGMMIARNPITGYAIDMAVNQLIKVRTHTKKKSESSSIRLQDGGLGKFSDGRGHDLDDIAVELEEVD